MARSKLQTCLLALLCVALVLLALGPLPHGHDGWGHDDERTHDACALCAHGALAGLVPDAVPILVPLTRVACHVDVPTQDAPATRLRYATAPRGPPGARV